MCIRDRFYRPDDTAGVFRPSRGILLWGPPGTGKTMLAKAIARESNSVFLNVTLSTVENKWFGESGKILAALFGLAAKLAPSVVFIDEIDGLAKARSDTDQAHHTSLKTQLLAMMDGITSTTSAVTFVGATNRASNLDAAVLRRLRRQIRIDMPDERGRQEILRKMLRTAEAAPGLDLAAVARQTAGFSGSDLNEACRAANMMRFLRHCRDQGVDVEAACRADDAEAAAIDRKLSGDCAPPPIDTELLLEAAGTIRRFTAEGAPQGESAQERPESPAPHTPSSSYHR